MWLIKYSNYFLFLVVLFKKVENKYGNMGVTFVEGKIEDFRLYEILGEGNVGREECEFW